MPHVLIGEIHQGQSREGTKMLHSQQLMESLLATTKNRITGRAVKFCRRKPAISALVVGLVSEV